MPSVAPRNKLFKNSSLPKQIESPIKRVNVGLKKEVLKLENEKTELKQLVAALKSENLRLQKKIAKCEASQISALNRAKVLEKASDPHGDISRGNSLRAMSDAELEAELAKHKGVRGAKQS